MNYNIDLTPGGGTNLPGPTPTAPAVTSRISTHADPGNARLAAGLATVRTGAAHFAKARGGDQDQAADLAARTFVPTFTVAVRVEHATFQSSLGTFLPRSTATLAGHLARALEAAAGVYAKEKGEAADAFAAGAIFHLDEREPLMPAERVAIAATACAVARSLSAVAS